MILTFFLLSFIYLILSIFSFLILKIITRKAHFYYPLVLPVIIDIFLLFNESPPIELYQINTNQKYSTNQKNLILITIDTLRADQLSCYGLPLPTSPIIDKLSKNSLFFVNCFSNVPATTPSHSTIMTGKLPFEHHSRFNAVPLSKKVNTISKIFLKRKVKTAAFISAYPLIAKVSNLNMGFLTYNQFLIPDKPPQIFYKTNFAKILWKFKIVGRGERKCWMTNKWVYKWLNKLGNENFFLWIHYYDPHLPYDPPEPYRSIFLKSKIPKMLSPSKQVNFIANVNNKKLKLNNSQINTMINLYRGEIRTVDANLEGLIYKLFQLNKIENTIIIITSDHGESFYEHNYFFSHSKNLYIPDLHVPLLIFSLNISKIHIIDNFIGLNSLFNLMKKLDFQRNFIKDNDFIYAENAEGVYLEPHKAKKEKILQKQRAIIKYPWYFIWKRDKEEMAIFNLENDLLQQNNLCNSKQTICIKYKKIIQKFIDKDFQSSIELKSVDKETKEILKNLGYIK